jgi:hypothetical protein
MEDFGLLQLYAESFQTGGALATYLKSYRAASKRKSKTDTASTDTAEAPMSAASASTAVMVTASALAAQVYPDSRFGSLHAKQLTGVRQRVCTGWHAPRQGHCSVAAGVSVCWCWTSVVDGWGLACRLCDCRRTDTWAIQQNTRVRSTVSVHAAACVLLCDVQRCWAV